MVAVLPICAVTACTEESRRGSVKPSAGRIEAADLRDELRVMPRRKPRRAARLEIAQGERANASPTS